MSKHLSDAFNDLLEIERVALIQGDFDKLSEILNQKSSFLKVISRSDEATLFDSLSRDVLNRNLALYDEALAGIRSIMKRMDSLRVSKSNLRYYTHNCEAQPLHNHKPMDLEKRA